MTARSVSSLTRTRAASSFRQFRWAGALAALALVQGVMLWRTFSGHALDELPTFIAELPAVFIAAQAWALASVLLLLWKVMLVNRYRPVAGVVDQDLPSVTVIVPAYNEGEQVYKTLLSLVQSDYPSAKLQIVTVDDGSKDDTWRWMQRAKEHLGDAIEAVHCAKNRGKRFALYEGFARAKGDVIVTVDSDSEVLPDTVRNLVSPFVVDSRVGAVAGNVRVLNQHEGAIPKMLDVSFTFAFEFMRASESMVDTVMCCPGALSAFRRDLVDRFKDEWVVQTFMGRPANIGEDRAMTNYVLEMGYLVRFQSNAIVLTEVPTATPQLCRMLLRWARSNVRETLSMAAFVFKRFRRESALGARINFVASALELFVGGLLFVPALLAVLVRPSIVAIVLGGAILTAALPGAIFATTRSGRDAWWALPYALYSAACLSWIGFYGLVTPQRSGWLTRQLPSAPTPALLGSPANVASQVGPKAA